MSVSLTGAWNYPTRVLAGPGRIAELPAVAREIGMHRPLIVTDKALRASPLIARLHRILEEGGLPAAVFGDVKGNPVESNLNAGLLVYRGGGHDGVVAAGGGSSLDIGKCIAFMSGQSRPVWDFEDVDDWWTRADPAGIAPVIAVPTTAGTGSEVGRAGVIINEATHEKKIIFHPLMLPKVTIADPELTVGLPPFLTMATGMDAFAHCFEAFCAPGFHPLADGIALEGMRLIKEYLPRAYRNGADIEARSHMLAAASMGGAAFQKGLGAVHSVSHPVGAFYDTHHGLTNAVMLPYVLIFNRSVIEERMALLSRVLDLPARGSTAVLDWLLAFRRDLGVPHTLAELGVQESKIPVLAEHAMRDPTAPTNPRPLTLADCERLIRAAIRGDLDF